MPAFCRHDVFAGLQSVDAVTAQIVCEDRRVADALRLVAACHDPRGDNGHHRQRLAVLVGHAAFDGRRRRQRDVHSRQAIAVLHDDGLTRIAGADRQVACREVTTAEGARPRDQPVYARFDPGNHEPPRDIGLRRIAAVDAEAAPAPERRGRPAVDRGRCRRKHDQGVLNRGARGLSEDTPGDDTVGRRSGGGAIAGGRLRDQLPEQGPHGRENERAHAHSLSPRGDWRCDSWSRLVRLLGRRSGGPTLSAAAGGGWDYRRPSFAECARRRFLTARRS